MAMKRQMVEGTGGSSAHSFLLDDDSTLPFSAPEVSALRPLFSIPPG